MKDSDDAQSPTHPCRYGRHPARRPHAVVAAAQSGNVPLTPEAWIATDSIRFLSYLGRPSLYINRGVALARGASMENGTLDLDVAASDTTNFLGVRNHAVQYASDPEFPWYRLRKESPGVYESYADMEAGAWTTMKIEVTGTKARLYVNGAAQPCLVINDLKHGDRAGRIALWAHVQTEAYFGPISITPR